MDPTVCPTTTTTTTTTTYLPYGRDAWNGTYTNYETEICIVQKKTYVNEHSNAYFRFNKILKLSDQYNLPVTNHIFQLLQFNIHEESLIE